MKNKKLNELIRKFITVTYVLALLLAITIGFAIGNIPENKWWVFLTVPTAIALFLFLATLVNIWVEHRYVVDPFAENVEIVMRANEKLEQENKKLIGILETHQIFGTKIKEK